MQKSRQGTQGLKECRTPLFNVDSGEPQGYHTELATDLMCLHGVENLPVMMLLLVRLRNTGVWEKTHSLETAPTNAEDYA